MKKPPVSGQSAPQNPPSNPRQDDKKARLEKALRQNLLRRKAASQPAGGKGQ